MDIQQIYNIIYIIREKRVMLDEDLAKLYGVKTKVLNQAILRNKERFPNEFMFKLSETEFKSLRSQIVTSKRGGRRYSPYVFTEHGAVMLATILKSKRAIQISIEVVKAFVKLRKTIISQQDITKQLTEIRNFMLKQSNKTDIEFKKVWKAIEELIKPTEDESDNAIGFRID